MGRNIAHRHLGRRCIAAMLVLDHTFLEALVANRDTVGYSFYVDVGLVL
jgi:hypothetical protein